jgi:hypothetical protein
MVWGQPGQIVFETLSPKKKKKQNGLEVCLNQYSVCFANVKPWVQTPIPHKNKGPLQVAGPLRECPDFWGCHQVPPGPQGGLSHRLTEQKPHFLLPHPCLGWACTCCASRPLSPWHLPWAREDIIQIFSFPPRWASVLPGTANSEKKMSSTQCMPCKKASSIVSEL